LKKDEWQLLAYGLLAALLVELAFWSNFQHHIHVSRTQGSLIVLGIAVAVYLLYLRRRARR
jgi:hypothetical protein